MWQAALNAVVVIGLLALVTTLSRVIVLRLALTEFDQIPIFWRLNSIAGILLAILLFIATIDVKDRNLSTLFLADSGWNTSLSDFIARYMNPWMYDFAKVINITVMQIPSAEHIPLSIIGAGFGLCLLVVGYMTCFGFNLATRRKVRVLGASLIWILTMSWLAFSIASLTFWAVHKVNFFFIFLVILFLRWPFLSIRSLRPGGSRTSGRAP